MTDTDKDIASRTFAVMRDERDYVVCDPDAPLAHDCLVVVKVAMGSGLRYFEGRLLTKHPARARTLDVDLDNGFRERRTAKENVTRIVGLFEANDF